MFKNKNLQLRFNQEFSFLGHRMLKKLGESGRLPGGSETPDTSDSLRRLKETVGNIPEEVLNFIDRNRTNLEGAIHIAIDDLSDAYDNKFPDNTEQAYDYFHKMTTFFDVPVVQEMFRIYAEANENGKAYISRFVDAVPGIWGDAVGLIFWSRREDGMTFSDE